MPLEQFTLRATLNRSGSRALVESPTCTFRVPTTDGPEAQVEVNLNEGYLAASGGFMLSEGAHEALLGSLDEDGTIKCEELWSEIKAINRQLWSAIDRTVVGLKYYFNQHRISDKPRSESLLWQRADDKPVRIKPPLRFIASVLECVFLDEHSTADLQAFVDSKKTILTAGLRHLHRAWNESNPAFRWIDATIAAELAIKECIIHLKPELEVLLLELPSPPLKTLYGKILESITGQRSSKLSQIHKGVEIRNKLIHRPQSERVDEEDATRYLDDIEVAIFELLFLMYPHDKVIERIYKQRAVVQISTS